MKSRRRTLDDTYPSATHAILAVDDSGIQKLKPVKKRQSDIRGKVVKRRFLRPKVSIVYMAGMAKRKLMMPNPRDADRALISERFACKKTSEE